MITFSVYLPTDPQHL